MVGAVQLQKIQGHFRGQCSVEYPQRLCGKSICRRQGEIRYLDAYSSEVSRYFRMANRPVMPRTLSRW